MTNRGNKRNQTKCHAIQKRGYSFHQDWAELLREIRLVVLSQESLDRRLQDISKGCTRHPAAPRAGLTISKQYLTQGIPLLNHKHLFIQIACINIICLLHKGANEAEMKQLALNCTLSLLQNKDMTPAAQEATNNRWSHLLGALCMDITSFSKSWESRFTSTCYTSGLSYRA